MQMYLFSDKSSVSYASFLAPMKRCTRSEATRLPVALTRVAGMSQMVPIIISVAAKDGSSPSTAQIRISPVIPPTGMAPSTTLSNSDSSITSIAIPNP